MSVARIGRIQKTLLLLCVLGASAVNLPGCGGDESEPSITLATTTSTRDSGLLEELLPAFEREIGVRVRVVAVGSGQALEMGRRGDADVLLTHAPEAEREFVAAGFGVARREVMHNDFVLVGPPDDPAGVKGCDSVVSAFETIAGARARFASREDDSGTHKRERAIWNRADRAPAGEWYLEVGSGMAATLRLASELRAYTLADRGTFLSQRDRLRLVVLCEGDPLLVNRYAVIRVNPERHPHVDAEASQRFVEFLLDPQTQDRIGEFGVERFGRPLFVPDAPAKANPSPPAGAARSPSRATASRS